MDNNSILNFIYNNLKNIFYPEDWLAIDLKIAKSELLSLLILNKYGELTMSQFSDYLHMPMNTATGLINRLVLDGYVQRERSDTDRRLVLIKTTEAGREIINKFTTLINDYLQLVDQALTEDEKNTLLVIAFKIMDILKEKSSIQYLDKDQTPQIEKIEID